MQVSMNQSSCIQHSFVYMSTQTKQYRSFYEPKFMYLLSDIFTFSELDSDQSFKEIGSFFSQDDSGLRMYYRKTVSGTVNRSFLNFFLPDIRPNLPQIQCFLIQLSLHLFYDNLKDRLYFYVPKNKH